MTAGNHFRATEVKPMEMTWVVGLLVVGWIVGNSDFGDGAW